MLTAMGKLFPPGTWCHKHPSAGSLIGRRELPTALLRESLMISRALTKPTGAVLLLQGETVLTESSRPGYAGECVALVYKAAQSRRTTLARGIPARNLRNRHVLGCARPWRGGISRSWRMKTAARTSPPPTPSRAVREGAGKLMRT
jgi:hypothetical protein